jgi:hypothetical protein
MRLVELIRRYRLVKRRLYGSVDDRRPAHATARRTSSGPAARGLSDAIRSRVRSAA